MKHNFHEDQLVGLTLAFIGGAMDGFTYVHYGTFATAQTGNLILAIIEAFDHQWKIVGDKLLSTVCFCLGIFFAKYLIDFFSKKQVTTWRLGFLYFEGLIFMVLGISNFMQHTLLVTNVISFIAAIQWVAFDKINGLTYTNLFTTGNLKSLVVSYYDYFSTKDRSHLIKAHHFFFVVTAFFSGAIATVYLYKTWQLGEKSLFIPATAVFGLALFESFMIWRFRKIEKNNLLH
ncbi:YoaK family protein [Vagococcus silagei]|uniref:DUF1275 domain-containing protein n=1 Tax=Vagococcus silagei TaxID=2508885 RepID=A0A4V3TUS5_9ENTE|nr:YoaK family protein [Vagococcus silagei]THB60099.1 DUF1275 domain-containing protein [Vagococcus silagei]